MNCEAVTKQLPLLRYGELSFDEEEQLEQHLEACESCQAESKRWESLSAALDGDESETDTHLLLNCRRSLRIGVSTLAESGPVRHGWFAGGLLKALYKPLGAVALVSLGFFGARYAPPLSDEARAARSLEPVASHVRYVEPGASGKVQILIEETRQRVLSGGMQEEPIRRLLLAAARESADPGVRVETMDLLASQSDSAEVRRALLHALQYDPNSGVRLKALEGLRSSSGDPETRRVMSQVLLTDKNPGVRTQAIDLLTQTREHALVGVLQELMTREDNNYVRLKCQKALSEMNASVETF